MPASSCWSPLVILAVLSVVGGWVGSARSLDGSIALCPIARRAAARLAPAMYQPNALSLRKTERKRRTVVRNDC